MFLKTESFIIKKEKYTKTDYCLRIILLRKYENTITEKRKTVEIMKKATFKVAFLS